MSPTAQAEAFSKEPVAHFEHGWSDYRAKLISLVARSIAFIQMTKLDSGPCGMSPVGRFCCRSQRGTAGEEKWAIIESGRTTF
jgi:hypothetical protein